MTSVGATSLNLFGPQQTVGGLASGLDTNSILQQLLAVERQPRTVLEQRQTLEQARKDAVTEIQTRLASLKAASTALKDPTLWTTAAPTTMTTDATVASGNPAALSAVVTGAVTPGTYNVQVNQVATAQQLRQSGSVGAVDTGDDTLYLQVGPGPKIGVAVQAGDSMATVAGKINATAGIQVYASTDAAGKLTLTSNVTGAANTISVTSENLGNQLAGELGLQEQVAAKDANVVVDGTQYTMASNVTSAAIPGLTLDLLNTTPSATFLYVKGSATTNPSAAVTDKVKAFVDSYNSLVDYVQTKLTEDRVDNPQTDADRQKGMLRNDTMLRSLLSDLRTSVSDIHVGQPSAVDSLAEIGISTGALSSASIKNKDTLAGKLTFDSSKLSSLLATNPDDVKALFTNATGDYSSEGLTQRIDRSSSPYARDGGMLANRIDSQTQLVNDLSDRMTALDTRLAVREQTLRTQFTNMETAMSQSQQMGNWLSGQIAGLSR
jgi:flagellar hook-associated protein 2